MLCKIMQSAAVLLYVGVTFRCFLKLGFLPDYVL